MKSQLIIALTLCFTPFIQAQNPAMKKTKKEAEEAAKKLLPELKKRILDQDTLGFSNDDLLPVADKGKKFDRETAKNGHNNPESIVVSSEIKELLKTTQKREILENDEAFMVQGQNIIQNPHSSAGIDSLDISIKPEEENLQVCEENGVYQASFTQTLSVTVTPEIKQQTKQCSGHKKVKEFFWKSKAEEEVKSKEKSFKKEKNASRISSYHVDIAHGGLFKDYAVVATWNHTDNCEACDSYTIKENLIQAAREEDAWQCSNPEGLALIETKPFCRLLYSNVTQGPETRQISGKSVFRDIWGRQLYFTCEALSDSKCAKLREQGGVIKGKKCLERNVFGECDLWQKTYDLGKKGAYQQTKASFQANEIWGLNNDFDSSYDKNTDFGSVFTTLAIFSDMEKNLQEQESPFNEKVKVFKGEKFACQKTFLQGQVFDCCHDLDGIAVNIKLARCTEQEKCLSTHRHDGKCRFIGSHKLNLGTVTEHVYCCFPSKLSRVLHEEGRKQLKMGWGKAEKPKCQGFSLSELQRIDFSKIDLSEVVDDIRLDKSAYEKKLKESVDSLKTKIQADIEKKRLERSSLPKTDREIS